MSLLSSLAKSAEIPSREVTRFTSRPTSSSRSAQNRRTSPVVLSGEKRATTSRSLAGVSSPRATEPKTPTLSMG